MASFTDLQSKSLWITIQIVAQLKGSHIRRLKSGEGIEESLIKRLESQQSKANAIKSEVIDYSQGLKDFKYLRLKKNEHGHIQVAELFRNAFVHLGFKNKQILAPDRSDNKRALRAWR